MVAPVHVENRAQFEICILKEFVEALALRSCHNRKRDASLLISCEQRL
jgi:hypothetical protein